MSHIEGPGTARVPYGDRTGAPSGAEKRTRRRAGTSVPVAEPHGIASWCHAVVAAPTTSSRVSGPAPPRGTAARPLRVEQQLLQVRRVAHPVVLVAVVHEQVDLPHLLGELLHLRHPRAELTPVVEVAEPLRRARVLRVPALAVAPVEADDRE